MAGTRILGCGHYLPKQCMKNAELPSRLDTSDEWIVERTGITQRYLAAEGETTSDLATHAAKAALADAQLDSTSIDLIIVATETPDLTMPGVAMLTQQKLGVSGGAAFDLHAACAGFVYALATADSMIRNGIATTALVIGAETFSRVVDWDDRGTCILFGDGAGAVVLQASNEARLLAHTLHAEGSLASILMTNGGLSTTQTIGTLTMQGREVFRHAVQKMGDVLVETADKAGTSVDALDWIIPHQANQRIIQSLAERYHVPSAKIISTVGQHANTSAASIPLALSVAQQDGRIKHGDLLGLTGLGAGLAWGATILQWK